MLRNRAALVTILQESAPAPIQFSDAFTRDDGAIGNDWAGATWTIATNKAINTPNLGLELATDGALENWTDALNLTSWLQNVIAPSTVNQETSVVQGGSNAAGLDIGASNQIALIKQTISGASVKSWLLVDFWMRSAGAQYGGYAIINGAGNGPVFYPGTTYTNYKASLRTGATQKELRLVRFSNTSTSLYFDTISVKQQVTAELMVTRPVYPTADYLLEVNIAALERGTWAGIVFALDDPANPQNYCILSIDGAQVDLWEIKAGVMTCKTTDGNPQGTSVFTANDKLTVAKLGASVMCYKNDVAIATVQTIDATLENNLYAGIFSTYSGNQFDNWSETVKAVGGSSAFLTPFFSGVNGNIFPIGDSVTTGATDEVSGTGYPILLIEAIAEETKGYWAEGPLRYAGGGWTTQNVKDGIDAKLAASTTTPTHVLIYLGANDYIIPGLDETTWKANKAYIYDAIHTKWPDAQIYDGVDFRNGYDAEVAEMMTWVAEAIAGRDYCHSGVDGSFMSGHPEWIPPEDGVHPIHAGFVALATNEPNGWKAKLGY